jgi:valyl-tRNA synthetase
MSIEKAYNPHESEQLIYKKWEKSGYFNPDECIKKGIISPDAKHYSIMMPPPNVTGVLHLGHAFEHSLMDIQARYQRMNGKRTVIIPGTDHAAVATQAKVEKILIESGISDPRKELGREKVLEKIREFAEMSQTSILNQIKRIGTSCDWSRLAYTFDEARSKTVNTVFKKMYEDGLIYQGYRVVNWSVKGQSTCSDDELEHMSRKATLYYFKYSADFPITIATTRPETKLGDTAVAVHPEDTRYKNLIGNTYTVDVGADKPLTIKIIADDGIDPEYGTGALGVTPAHSQIDFEMYEKNDIELIQVIGQDGKMTKEAGKEYEGLIVEDARRKFVHWLRQNGLLEKEEEIDQNVSTSDRFKDIVEALPLRQWFVAVNKEIPGRNKSLKDLMKEVVTTGLNNDTEKTVTITPQRYEKVYTHWINNLRDWCISRQIWWGHQIPIWYNVSEEAKKEWENLPDPSLTHFIRMNIKYTDMVYSESEPEQDGYWIQDPDTLDTWFSSAMWTFSTLGWPEITDDFTTFHPTTWMQMGHEILPFWMARMILMTTYIHDDIPFKDVYIHGILRDEEGRKFSKSLGNGIDPLEMIDKYGTDALRLSLLSDVTAGNDSRFYEEKVEYYRNMINKLWNISRYIFMTVESVSKVEHHPEPQTESDTWILLKLDELTQNIHQKMNNYHFSPCIELLRNFMWNDFADWYIEIAKIEKNKDSILLYIFQEFITLLHPFAPYVTELLWENYADNPSDMLMVRTYPPTKELSSSDSFDHIRDIITHIRSMRSENHIKPKTLIRCFLENTSETATLIESQLHIITKLARCEIVHINTSPSDNTISSAIGSTTIHIELDGMLDEDDKARISKEVEQLTSYITSLKRKLSNSQFVDNAPTHIVEQEKSKLQEALDKLAILEKQVN